MSAVVVFLQVYTAAAAVVAGRPRDGQVAALVGATPVRHHEIWTRRGAGRVGFRMG